jgi:hypothetical protein
MPAHAGRGVVMNTGRWPEAVAAGINLIEVALGPEIAEEAFSIVMGMGTFEAACRGAVPKRRGGTILS